MWMIGGMRGAGSGLAAGPGSVSAERRGEWSGRASEGPGRGEGGAKAAGKSIEVALPLDDGDRAAAREKSIGHGYPSTLRLWWCAPAGGAGRVVRPTPRTILTSWPGLSDGGRAGAGGERLSGFRGNG